MDALRTLFSFVCGQQHNWVLGGVTLPFCQRCTGLYVGAFGAFLLIIVLRPAPRALLYWLHGFFMLFMLPFGFHLLPHGGLMRTFTGTLFAFGLVYYLALNPLSVWIGWNHAPRAQILTYLSLIVTFIASLLICVRWGGAAIAQLLAIFGALGMVALLFLTITNLLVLPRVFRSLLRDSASAP